MNLNEIEWENGEGLEELDVWGIQPMQWCNEFLSPEEGQLFEKLPEGDGSREALKHIYYFFEEKLEAMAEKLDRFGEEVRPSKQR